MKTKILILVVIIGMMATLTSTFADTPSLPTTGGGGTSIESPAPVGTVNSEEVARLIASKGITEFKGTFEFDRVSVFSPTTGEPVVVQHVSGTFRLWYGRITDLVINGVEIPNDNDRYTLPVNNVGTVRHFHLRVEGVNDRESVLYGDFGAYELQPTQTIQIVLKPNAVPFFLAYTPGPGTTTESLRFSIQSGDDDGYDTFYDTVHGGFSVWLTPGIATTYRIYGENNRTIEVGSLDTTRLVVTPSEEPTLGISVLGNVGYTLNGWFSQSSLKLDSTIIGSDGTLRPGKVVAYNNGEGRRLEITTEGLCPGSTIAVKNTNQELTILQSFTVPPGGGYVTFVTSGIVRSSIVTITGTVQDLTRGFVLNLNALYEDGPTPLPPVIREE